MKAHVLAADWLGGDLHILADSPQGLIDVSWQGSIDWTVAPGRHCVGTITRDGHIPCPVAATVGHDRQCAMCAPSWSACVFEPALHGPREHCTLCQRPHVVYLAMHGTLPKVGMTTAARIETRLREQGADAYFVIQERRDRLGARNTERAVATLYGIPERRRHHETFRQLTRPLDRDLVQGRAASWRERLAERFDVGDLRLLEHPLGVLPGRPQRVEPEGHHAGVVLGAKGDHLFYQGTGDLAVGGAPVRALQRSALAGRTLTIG